MSDSNRGARKLRAYIVLSLVIIAVMFAGWYYYREYSMYYSTDDAYIDADRVSVSSKILGRIAQINGDEGDTVHEGELLVMLDSSDLLAQRVHLTAVREQSVAALHQAQAKLDLDEKTVKIQEIALARAQEDYERASVQFEGKVIAREQYDHLKKAWESAQAQIAASNAQLQVSKTQIESAEVSIRSATAQIGTVETQLHNTRIFAPCSGRIAKRWLLKGDITQPGQSVLTVTRDSVRWVVAYFEETKVGGITLNQPATFTVDAFPGVQFSGNVYNIGTNTAAQFSLIPPNNASGNFTKVTQRIPVKISIKACDGVDKTVMSRLISGMSVIVKIRR